MSTGRSITSTIRKPAPRKDAQAHVTVEKESARPGYLQIEQEECRQEEENESER